MVSPLKRLFNMVEVTLAIAVVGLGITAVMGMFPVAINSSRDAVAESCSGEMATQFISYIEARAVNDWTVATGLPTSAQDIAASDSDTKDDGSAWASPVTGLNIYASGGKLSSANGVFGVKSGTDFSAHVRVWRTDIGDFYSGASAVSILDTYAVKLNIEISWPSSRPFSTREKRYYTREIFKQN